MSIYWGRLANTMEQELACYEALQKLSQEEQQHLVEENVEALDRVIKQIEGLVLRIRDIEMTRTNLVEGLMAEEGLSASLDGFHRLVDEAEGAEAETYRNHRETLQQVVHTIGDVNRTNSLLVQNSLRFIDETMRAITGAVEECGTYAEGGDRPVSSDRSFHLLDRVF